MLSASGRLCPQVPYWGFAPGSHWGTSVPMQTSLFCGVQKILKLNKVPVSKSEGTSKVEQAHHF